MFPALEGFERVIVGHLEDAVITPKATHCPLRGKGCLLPRVRRSGDAFLRGFRLHPGGFPKLLPLSLLSRAKSILYRRTPAGVVIAIVLFHQRRGVYVLQVIWVVTEDFGRRSALWPGPPRWSESFWICKVPTGKSRGQSIQRDEADGAKALTIRADELRAFEPVPNFLESSSR